MPKHSKHNYSMAGVFVLMEMKTTQTFLHIAKPATAGLTHYAWG